MEPLFFVIIGIVLTLGAAWFWSLYLGFAAQTVDDYADLVPVLHLRDHLAGNLVCDGMIFGPTGRVTSRFRADIQVAWDGPNGVMDERFHYDDGSTQDRQWRLTIDNDGSLRAEADDVIGAGRGTVGGNALGLRYRIRLPDANGGHVLDAVDWMYLQRDGTILNRSQFRKFGIRVAELFCTMRPARRPEERRDA